MTYTADTRATMKLLLGKPSPDEKTIISELSGYGIRLVKAVHAPPPREQTPAEWARSYVLHTFNELRLDGMDSSILHWLRLDQDMPVKPGNLEHTMYMLDGTTCVAHPDTIKALKAAAEKRNRA